MQLHFVNPCKQIVWFTSDYFWCLHLYFAMHVQCFTKHKMFLLSAVQSTCTWHSTSSLNWTWKLSRAARGGAQSREGGDGGGGGSGREQVHGALIGHGQPEGTWAGADSCGGRAAVSTWPVQTRPGASSHPSYQSQLSDTWLHGFTPLIPEPA